MSKVSRLEVIQTGSRRRWSAEEKYRIVAESESGSRQVSATARRHGLLPSQLFTWRRLAREGRLHDAVGFAQAVIACELGQEGASSPVAADCGIEITLADGLRVTVAAGIDPGALARIIAALERR